MSVRISSDKRECRVHVAKDEDLSYVKETLVKLASEEKCVSMPDEIVKSAGGYDLVFRNRKSIKEYICFDGFGKKEFTHLTEGLREVFGMSERLGIDPYGFVFDISCIFYDEGFKNLSFVFTPGHETKKNNMCCDLLSIVSLYSGFETDSEEEKLMREAVGKVREWEESSEELSYDFPACFGREEHRERPRGRMICISERRPRIKIFSFNKDGDICKVGRDPDWADICTSSPFSGRHHAEIFIRSGEFVIRDLGSVNGTYVSGTRVGKNMIFSLGRMTKLILGGKDRIILVCISGM